MNEIYNEVTGVSDIYFAPITKDDEAEYIVGTPTLLAPAASIVNTPSISNKTTYYSNKPANSFISEGATEVKMVIPNLPISKAAIVLGKEYDALTGRMYDDGSPNPPFIALGFRFDLGMGNYRYYWYLKGNCKGGAEEAATKTETINEKTYELTFTGINTTYAFLINGAYKSQKRTVADDTDEAFVGGDSWFTQVQTPLISGAPDAISLVSTVPDAAAIGVLGTANVVITFNNAIASDNIFVSAVADGAVIATVKAYDTAKKVLTLTHVAAFTSGAKYLINIVGVKDVYGQTLATTARLFTVA